MNDQEIQEHIARIDKSLAETHKLTVETRKLIIESQKPATEAIHTSNRMNWFECTLVLAIIAATVAVTILFSA